MIDFRLSVDFGVVFLALRSDGETGGVCDSKWWSNQMNNAHYSFLYFNELLYYGRVRGSLISFKHLYFKIEFLLQIKKQVFNFLARVQEVGFKHKTFSICFNYH